MRSGPEALPRSARHKEANEDAFGGKRKPRHHAEEEATLRERNVRAFKLCVDLSRVLMDVAQSETPIETLQREPQT